MGGSRYQLFLVGSTFDSGFSLQNDVRELRAIQEVDQYGGKDSVEGRTRALETKTVGFKLSPFHLLTS